MRKSFNEDGEGKENNVKDKRITITDIQSHKSTTPLVCLTAYTAPFAQILDQHCDVLLVGDSLGMVVYGMESTLAVSVQMMINHGKAVVSHSHKACVVVDMPFGSYQASEQQAFEHAAQIMAQTGCQAVKLEGGQEMASTIGFLVERGIPVMGHVGVMPQHVNSLGGYGARGREQEQENAIMQDSLAVQQSGAFALVLEGVVEPLAKKITKTLAIPTIGIGASAACDGQVLVTEDMAGLFTAFTPKFVKQYGSLAKNLDNAVKAYAKEVRERQFPGKEHCFL